MAALLAASKVGPLPIPEDFVMGHQDLTVMSLPKAAPEPTKKMNEIANKRFMISSWCNSILSNLDKKFMQYNENWYFMTRYLFLLAAALVLFPCSASAELLLRKDGVTLAVTTLVDRVVFCITATGDIKVSSEYGVELKSAPHDARSWLDALPKVVTGVPYYFDLPLRVELKTRGNARERRVDLNLGACSAAANACLPVTFEVRTPIATEDGPAADCSAHSKGRPAS
jgi:hypothetical protein